MLYLVTGFKMNVRHERKNPSYLLGLTVVAVLYSYT